MYEVQTSLEMLSGLQSLWKGSVWSHWWNSLPLM